MRKKSAKRILTLLLSLVMVLAMCIPSFAADEDSTLTATDDPRESILLMTLGYEDDNGNYEAYQAGTSFLINDEYVLTNKHVVTVSNENWSDFSAFVKNTFGVENVQANDSHIKLYLYVNRDMKVGATMHESVNSDDLDFAAVKLAEKIYDRKPIALGDSSVLEVKDDVYAMGFPADSISTKEYNTKDDVSTSAGKVSKLTVTGSVDIIEHSAQLTNGNSGGPLLNSDNEVIGVNTFIAGEKNYSTQINYIKTALDTFGIAYVSESGSSSSSSDSEAEEVDVRTELGDAITSAKSLDLSSYTTESQTAYNDIIDAADAIYANDDATDEELEQALSDVQGASSSLVEAETDTEEEETTPAKNNNMGLIIAIAAAVIIVIIIIIVIVMKSGKKKNAPVPGPAPMYGNTPVPPTGAPGAAPRQNPYSQQVPQQPVYGVPSQASYGTPGSEDTSLLNSGSDETTLLDAGAGETSLLGGSKAYLIRKKNGEKVSITGASFKIGKERRKVNYCISDNTSVSRVHCEIIRKGADYYIIDQGATNFTFVNGVQLSPHKETILSDRSIVKLSDEEFEFHI